MTIVPDGPSACGCESCVVRFEACDLRTGIIRAVLFPASAAWQTTLNQPGQGNVVLPTDATLVRNIWPHLTSIYVTVGGAPVWAGIVEEFLAESSENGGTTTVQMKEITYYLSRRHHDQTLTFNQASQNVIGASLVNNAQTNGIPLTGVAAPTQFYRDRTYEAWEHGELMERIQQLTEVVDGPDYEVVHIREDGRWRTQMIFRDEVGEQLDLTVTSDNNASDYSLSVSADTHATHVHGIGAGEEEDQLEVVREDTANIYPRFDAAPAWKDVTNPNTLAENTGGYLEMNREPVAVPAATIPGCHDIGPDEVLVGDTINANVSQGAVTFRGRVRVADISWRYTNNSEMTRELGMVPVGRASDTVLNQEPSDPCPDCGPEGMESL
jgi:hypothetical protein